MGRRRHSPHGRLYIMFGPVITSQAHSAYAGARLHSNNTAALSSIVEVLSFLGPHGPVARDSQACIFHDSRQAASICLGTVQSRANVALGLTRQRVLLHIQFYDLLSTTSFVVHRILGMSVQTMHAAAFGTFGLVSNQNIRTRWTHPSIPFRCLRHVTTLITQNQNGTFASSTTSGQKLVI